MSKEAKKRVAIIGAGASGLASARQALQYGWESIVFEKTSHIGGIWHYDEDPKAHSIWRSLSTQQSKAFCAFSDFPLMEDAPPRDASHQFLHHTQVDAYLAAYARHFDVRVRLRAKVHDVRRADDWAQSAKWLVSYAWRKDDEADVEHLVEEFDAVLICTGFYSLPYRPPELRLESQFRGRISHSAQYRRAAYLDAATVVVAGFGNSAITIASELATVAKKVYIASRRGAWLLSKLPDGRPWDITVNSQFYALARRGVPRAVRNFFWRRSARQILDHDKAGIRPQQSFLSTHLTFADTLPYQLAQGRVKIVPRLLSFTNDGRGVEFEDNTVVEHVDEVIFCTGFTFDLPFLEDGKLVHTLYNDFHLYKQMFAPQLAAHNNLALIGYLQPTGPMFPIVELQARLFFAIQAGHVDLPTPAKMKAKLERKRCNLSLNYVKTQRYTQIEDYVDYMNDLARLVGCAPNFCAMLLRGEFRLAAVCFFGPATAHQYRIEGPHAWPAARAEVLAHYSLFPKTSWLDNTIIITLCALIILWHIYDLLY